MSELAYCKTHYISYCPELSATCPYCRIEKLEARLDAVQWQPNSEAVMKRMTYERLAEYERMEKAGLDLAMPLDKFSRELLQALKLEREEVKSRGEMMELWSEEMATDRERIAELEARLDAVEGLPDKWNEIYRAAQGVKGDDYSLLLGCALELKEALGGGDEST